MFERVSREREGWKEEEAEPGKPATPPAKGSPGSLPPRPPPLRAPPSPSRKPLFHRSLLILPEHVVLFALHVLKVKVAPGHALVDVLDVVAGGLEVSGGVVGPGGEDLGERERTTALRLTSSKRKLSHLV